MPDVPDSFRDLSHAGFLGKDESLLELIQKDLKVVFGAGTTPAAIANVLAAAMSSYNERVFPELAGAPLSGGFEYMPIRIGHGGVQECPWEDVIGGITRGLIFRQDFSKFERMSVMGVMSGFDENSIDWIKRSGMSFGSSTEEIDQVIERMSKGLGTEIVIVTDLLPHLIAQHYFFEGRGTSFRADPATLISAFGLTRG
jgi:hypothetical protein